MNSEDPLLPTTDYSEMVPADQIPLSCKLKQRLQEFSKKANLSALLTPSTIAAVVGFAIGMIGPIRKLLIGQDAALHVVEDSAVLLGDAAIPTVIIILGANLLRGVQFIMVSCNLIRCFSLFFYFSMHSHLL